VYKNKPFTLTLILLIVMAVLVYFCEPLLTSKAFGCESGQSKSDAASNGAGSQNAASSVGNSTQSSTSGDVSQHGVAQMDNGGHEGNGGESVPLLTPGICDNPYWFGFILCREKQ